MCAPMLIEDTGLGCGSPQRGTGERFGLVHGAEVIGGSEGLMQLCRIARMKLCAELRVQMLGIFAEPGGTIHHGIVKIKQDCGRWHSFEGLGPRMSANHP